MTTAPKPTLLRRYAHAIIRRRYIVIILILVASIIAGRGVTRLYIEVDPDRELPQSHPYVVAFHETHKLFGDQNLLVIGLRPTAGSVFDPHFLARLKEITGALATVPGVSIPLLQSIGSNSTRDIIAAPDGLRVWPLLSRLPESPTETAILRQRVLRNDLFRGTLVSYDASMLAIHASFELTTELPGYVDLYAATGHVLATHDDSTISYALSGPVAIGASLNIYATRVAYFFPLALLVIGLIHYHAFRTWQAVFLPLATGILAVVWAVGLMGHLGVPLDPLNSTTPVLILAVGAGHAVQILKRYYEEYGRLGDNEAAIVESTARVGGVMIAAGLIAALSFLSLATLGTDSMRTFGIFTAFGILSVLVIEMTSIPAMRAILRPPRREDWASEDRIHPRLSRALAFTAERLAKPAFAKRVLVAFGLLVLASLLLAQRIQVDTSFKRNFSPDDPIRQQDDLLNRQFAGTNVLLFTVEGPVEGAIAEPAALRGIDAFETRMESLPGVGKAISVVDTLKQLHHALNPEVDADALPGSKDLATQYLFLYTLSGGNDLATRLTTDNRMAKIVVLLREDSTRYGDAVIAEARRIAAEVLPSDYVLHVAGTLASNSALTETMVRGKILNVVQIGAITVLIATVLLRSFLAGLLVAVPLAIAVLMNFGLMGAADVRLDIATAAVTAMAVGIGADYAVYFLFRMREEYALDGDFAAALARSLTSSGKAVLFVSSAVGLGYSVLCLSGFRLFVQLGALVGLAMVTSSIATLLVLPAMLTLISRTPWIRSVLGAPARSIQEAPG